MEAAARPTFSKTQPSNAWWTMRTQVNALRLTSIAIVAIAMGIGIAGLLGLGVNSMSTFKSLSIIGAGFGLGFATLILAGYLCLRTYEEVKEYLSYLEKNEFIAHLGSDADTPRVLGVSAYNETTGKPDTLEHPPLEKIFVHTSTHTLVYLDELQARAAKASHS